MHCLITLRFYQDFLPMFRLLLLGIGSIIATLIILHLIDVIISLIRKNKKKRFAKSCYMDLKNSYNALMIAKEMYKDAEALDDPIEKSKKTHDFKVMFNESLTVLKNPINYQYSELLPKEYQTEIEKFKESSKYSLN